MEKLEYLRHILLFEFNIGAKAEKSARNICAVYGDNAIGESTARKWFSRFKEDHFDNSDTPCSGRPSGFKHINPQWSTSVYSRTGKCYELWPFHHRATFAFNGRLKIGCMGTSCSKSKSQNQRAAIYAALLASHRLAREKQRPFLSCIVIGDDT